MKRENLYLVAGALLASTSLTSMATAGTMGLVKPNGVAYGATAGIAQVPLATALAISAQAFSATAATANAVTSGAVNLYMRFNAQLLTTFSATISITGAQFASASSTATGVVFETSAGTLAGGGSVIGVSAACAGSVAGSDVILLSSCNGNGVVSVVGVGTTINGLLVTNVTFTAMSGLATAGNSIGLSAVVSVNNVSFETTASASEITSRDSVTVSGTAGTTANIDVAAAKGAFTGLTTSVSSAVIATIQLSVNNALGTDLSTVITAANAVGGTEIRVTSAITADDATQQFRLTSVNGGGGVTTSVFAGGFVTFQLTNAAFTATDSYRVNVDFNGTKEIDAAAAGTAVTAFTAVTAGAGVTNNITAPPSGTVATAVLQRNGLTIDLNGVYGGGFPITYTSVIRIANTGAISAVPTIAIYDEANGSLLGTASNLVTIAGGASRQYLMSEIETAAGLTASTKTYRLTVTGGLTGYVQQLLWNQTGGFFTDLSGRRTTKTGNN